jgi:sulfur transfer complex TusBCD TusB component (DsrH family)
MLSRLESDGCIYQDDVVDYLVKNKADFLLRENSVGTLVLGTKLLEAFRNATETTVVWVKPDLYWRWRVAEDEIGREARG